MEDQGKKHCEPSHGNIYWNYFRILSPYIISLLILLIIFYFFPLKNKFFMFAPLIFFVVFSAILLLNMGKFVEFAWLFYFPVYGLYLFLYFFMHYKDGKDKDNDEDW